MVRCGPSLEVETRPELDGPRIAAVVLAQERGARRLTGAPCRVDDEEVLLVGAVEAVGVERQLAGAEPELLRQPQVERLEGRLVEAVAAEVDAADRRAVGAALAVEVDVAAHRRVDRRAVGVADRARQAETPPRR